MLEGAKDIPFEIKRIFYIWNNVGCCNRGGHAHKELYQAFIAVSGSCRLLLDDVFEKKEHILNDPSSCIIISPKIWVDISEFSENCILLILASDYFEETDYIRNYQEYIDYVRNN